MIKEREKVVNNFIAVLDVFVGIGSFLFALVLFFKSSTFLNSRDFQIIIILIAIIWWIMSKSLSLSILHRSRPLSNILFKCFQLAVTGTVFLGLFIYVVFTALTKAPLTPKNNPYIEVSKHFHY